MAQNPEAVMTKNMGMARRKSGIFGTVQYRNRPIFLGILEELPII